MKPNTVLIPLDGSAFSRQVLPHIRRIFNPDQYALILLRVEQAPEGVTAAPARLVLVNNTLVSLYESRTDANLARHPIYATQVADSLRAELEDELRPEVRALKEAGYEAAGVVRFGDSAAEIVDYAEREQVQVIAMATHGRTGISRLALGSVAEQVLRSAQIPVLMVHPS